MTSLVRPIASADKASESRTRATKLKQTAGTAGPPGTSCLRPVKGSSGLGELVLARRSQLFFQLGEKGLQVFAAELAADGRRYEPAYVATGRFLQLGQKLVVETYRNLGHADATSVALGKPRFLEASGQDAEKDAKDAKKTRIPGDQAGPASINRDKNWPLTRYYVP